MELKLLLLVFGISSVLSQCTIDVAKLQFKRSVFDFSIELMMRIAQEKDNHFVASTLSPWSLLSCISLGAADKTLAELRNVLHLHPHACFNNKFLDIVKSINSNTNEDVFVERSAIIFSDTYLPVNDKFKNTLARKGVADFQVISFENEELSARLINNYVSQATHNTIQEIVAPEDLEGIIFLMIDAIFFKGNWKTPFMREETEVSAFYNERGVQTGDVNLMFLMGQFNYKAVDQIQAFVLELPYGTDEKYSALFMLPYTDVSLFKVIENMKSITLTTFRKLFELEGVKSEVAVQIPRFKISSDLNNLRELLIDMGLRSMFDIAEARFPYISEIDLSVSDFIQKADIEVTEEGTTASAASEAGFTSRSLPEKFTANRPFLYMIVDNNLDVPLFVGAYSKPSVY